LAHWEQQVQAVTATSGEVLEGLDRLLGEPGQRYLRATPLVVAGERLEATASQLGYTRVWRAAGAGETDLVAALCGMVGESRA
jgi:uroporphyrinogen-III synthase